MNVSLRGWSRKSKVAGAKVHAVDTDWRDVVYRTALMQNYSATLSKGSDNGASRQIGRAHV